MRRICRSIAGFRKLLISVVSLFGAMAVAQEFSALGGIMGTTSSHENSYAWQLDYRYHFNNRLAWSASWLNEGHTASHHRDGLAAEVWADVFVLPQEFTFAIGGGAYYFADTHFISGNGYHNRHGWTPLLSFSATYYTNSPWFVRLTGNHVENAAGMESDSLLVGAGYQFGWHQPDDVRALSRPRASSVFSAMAGRAIVNSRSSENATAFVAEYRKTLGRHYDWTISWINEGDPQVQKREGAASQIWLVDAHPERRVGLGLGVGAYYCFERDGPPGARTRTKNSVVGLVSPSFSYRLATHWLARVTWNRVLSSEDRDADVIVAGVGYRWGAK